MQKYSDETQVKVFEASPTPRGAILILASASSADLKVIGTAIRSNSQYQPFIENLWLGENLSEKLINAYLNQILAPLKNHLVLIETESVCEALKAASLALDNNLEICEFRTLRSAVYKCIVSLTTSLSQSDIETIFAHLTVSRKISLNYFATPARELRNQYNLE